MQEGRHAEPMPNAAQLLWGWDAEPEPTKSEDAAGITKERGPACRKPPEGK